MHRQECGGGLRDQSVTSALGVGRARSQRVHIVGPTFEVGVTHLASRRRKWRFRGDVTCLL